MIKKEIARLLMKEQPKNPMEYMKSIARPFMISSIESAIRNTYDKKRLWSGYTGHCDSTVLIFNENILEDQVTEYHSKPPYDHVYAMEDTKVKEILDKELYDLHVNRNHIFYANAVNIFPHVIIDGKVKKRPPTAQEIEDNRIFAETLINTLEPALIILLGSVPMSMFGKGNIMKEHGKLLTVKGYPAMPIYNPTFLLDVEKLKSKEVAEEYWHDFRTDLRRAFHFVQETCKGNVMLEKIEL